MPAKTTGAIVLLVVATSAWLSYRMSLPAPEPTTATVLPAPADLNDFSLQNQYGQRIGRNVFEGHWNLLFFGFTRCPDVCPTTMQVLAAAKHRLAGQGFEPLPRLVLVSVDPERDTPDLLGRYIDNFGDNNLGITGDLEELRRLTGGLGIFFQKSAGIDGDYSVDHSAVVLVVNPRAQFHALFSAPHKIENYVNDLPLILADF